MGIVLKFDSSRYLRVSPKVKHEGEVARIILFTGVRYEREGQDADSKQQPEVLSAS